MAGAKDTAKETKVKPGASSRRSSTRTRAGKKKQPDIQLTADRLVVQVPENGERKTAGGLLIPATAVPAPKRLSWGDVTLIGPDVRVAKEGDRVLFLPSAGLEVELEGEEYVLLRERDVQAVSSKPADGAKDRTPGQYL